MSEPATIKVSLLVRCPYCIQTCYVDGLVAADVWDHAGKIGDKHAWFGQEMTCYGGVLSREISDHIEAAHPTELHRALQTGE